jgi:hypothetical protein
VQRIETGAIGRGVPDVFVAGRKGDLWVELKSVRTNPYEGMIIPWRAGQQAWMYSYYRATGRHCYTIVKCPRKILAIPMIKIFPRNMLSLADAQAYDTLKELII